MERRAAPCCGANVRCEACGVRLIAICGAVDDRHLARLAAVAGTKRLPPGSMLFEEGEPAEDVFTLTEGMLKLYKLMPDGRRQITGFMMPGDFIGLAYGDDYIYSVEAVVPSVVCRFRRGALLGLMTEFPELEHRLLSRASNELAAAQAQMLLLGRKTARERLASFLLALAERVDAEKAASIALPMTRSDIADYLGLTIETVSRTLTSMRKDGLIHVPDKHRIVIRDVEALREAAGDEA